MLDVGTNIYLQQGGKTFRPGGPDISFHPQPLGQMTSSDGQVDGPAHLSVSAKQ